MRSIITISAVAIAYLASGTAAAKNNVQKLTAPKQTTPSQDDMDGVLWVNNVRADPTIILPDLKYMLCFQYAPPSPPTDNVAYDVLFTGCAAVQMYVIPLIGMLFGGNYTAMQADGAALCQTQITSLLQISTTDGPCLKPNMDAKGEYTTRAGDLMMTTEGIPAVNEAIAFLQKQTPITVNLTFSLPLWSACRDLGEDQAVSAGLGHTGSDGSTPWTRMARYATIDYPAGENVAYGSIDPKDAIVQLIIDDGEPQRGHRTNMFSANWLVNGNYWGTHPTYGQLFCQDFAKGVTPLA